MIIQKIGINSLPISFYPCIIGIICCILYFSVTKLNAESLPFEIDRPLYVGSRPLGMGNAFISIADNAESGFWNPAGLIQHQGVNIFFSGKIGNRDSDVFDSKCISYCYRNMALFWGNKLALKLDDGSIPDFNYYSFSYKMNSYIAGGLSIKFKRKHPCSYYQFFGNETTYDLGFLFKPDIMNSAGIIIQKLNEEKLWIDAVVLGFSHRIYDNKLISTDLAYLVNDRKLEAYIGCELDIIKWLSVRIGVSNKSPTAGFGIDISRLKIDIAFVRNDKYISAFLSTQIRL